MTMDVDTKETQDPSISVASGNAAILMQLKECVSLIETGAYGREVRRIARSVRLPLDYASEAEAEHINTFFVPKFHSRVGL
ncbi:unnamed protein product [Rhodiola kirilowii]